MTRTFKYTGKLDSLIFEHKGINYELFRNASFTADVEGLCKKLEEHPQVVEIKPEDAKSSSRKNVTV